MAADIIATNHAGWRALVSLSVIEEHKVGGQGLYFHQGSLVGMGMWIDFDRQTGEEIIPKWRKRSQVIDPADVYHAEPELIEAAIALDLQKKAEGPA